MKRILICLLGAMILVGCLCGCGRTDTQDMMVSPAPTMTAVPEILPEPDEGRVNDSNGIIEDGEDKHNDKREERDDSANTTQSSASPSPRTSAAPSASPSASPET